MKSALALFAVGLGYALYRYARQRRQHFVSWRWLNDQERRALNKSQEFIGASVDWERHRWQ
jgi:hypothetical protein